MMFYVTIIPENLAQHYCDRNNGAGGVVHVIVIKCNKNKFRGKVVKTFIVVLQAFGQD
jgi:hypothetical protein